MTPKYAVLSGDIVSSSRLSSGGFDAAIDALENAATGMETWLGKPTHFTRCRGDGWQMILFDPRFGMRAAILMKAKLRGTGKALATRISIATARDEIKVSSNLNLARGMAFTQSGLGLDRMSGVETLHHQDGGAMGAVACLADVISARWTSAQARAMSHALQPVPAGEPDITMTDIARKLRITRQATHKSLMSAGYKPLRAALELIEA